MQHPTFKMEWLVDFFKSWDKYWFFLFQFTEGKFGIPDKTDVGLLVWYKDVNVNKTLKIGSRLKTPTLPIWTVCVNDIWGVLFSPNIELIRSQNLDTRWKFWSYKHCPEVIFLRKFNQIIHELCPFNMKISYLCFLQKFIIANQLQIKLYILHSKAYAMEMSSLFILHV